MAEKLTPYGLVIGLIPKDEPDESSTEDIEETVQDVQEPVEDKPRRGRPRKNY